MSDALEEMRKYVRLRQREAELADKGKAIKEEADKLQDRLLNVFAEMGVDKITLDGKTIYLHAQTWASIEEGHKPELIEALRAHGFDHIVGTTVNSNTLSGLVRDYDREGLSLPADVMEHVKTTDKYTLRVRRSG